MKKLIAAILTALMVATPLAMAADLGDYPAFLADNGVLDAYVVVGADADPADVVGAVDLATRLAAESYRLVSSSGGVSVSGGKTKDLTLNTYLNGTTGFGGTVDHTDIPGLLDGSLSINNLISGTTYDNDYDVHDELRFVAGASSITLETGLTGTSPSYKYKSDAFLEVLGSSVGYYYVFDNSLKAGNYIYNASDDYPVEIQFLGRTLTISSATASSMTIQSGTEYSLNVGEKVVVDGVTITLDNVGSGGSIVVTVDGQSGTISNGGSKVINGVTIKNKESFYSTEKADRSAVLRVGQDVTTTVNDGDAYCVGAADKNACEDDALWVWSLANLDQTTPTIGILFNQRLDQPEEVIKVGSEFALPHDYMKIRLDSYTVNDYKKYTVEANSIVDLYPATTNTVWHSSAVTIHVYAEGSSKDSFVVAGNSKKTDNIYLYKNTTTNSVEVYYKDTADNKLRYAGSAFAADSGAWSTSNSVATMTFGDTQLPLKLLWGNSTASAYNGSIVLATTAGDDVYMWLASDFSYLGHSLGDTTTGYDLQYGVRDISGWEEDTRAEDGVVIFDPKAHLSGDSFEFNLPGDEGTNFKCNVVILGPSGSTSGGTSGKIKEVVPVSTAVAKLDTEITDPATAGKNLVLVGGPAVNRLSAQALGLTYPTYGSSGSLPFAEGEGYIALKSDVFTTGQEVVVVAGWAAENTRDATSVLQQVDSFTSELTGNMAVKVTAVSAAGITPV